MLPAASTHRSLAIASDASRARLARTLTGRFWLRWHVGLMLAGAFCTGFLVNAALLQVPLHSIVVRWVAALACGYVAWFALMRLWLAYVGVRPFSRSRSLDGDASGLDGGGWSSSPGGSGGGSGGGFSGGGGGSGGGGVSVTFEGPGTPSVMPTISPGVSHGGGIDIGDGFSIDDGGLLVVLAAVVLVLVASLGGVVVYMVHEAPQLLVDVAFGSALASGFAGTTRRVVSSLDWCGSVWRATWKPFILLAISVLACAVAFAVLFPGARTLGEAFMLWRT
jgi:hypothetical protein